MTQQFALQARGVSAGLKLCFGQTMQTNLRRAIERGAHHSTEKKVRTGVSRRRSQAGLAKSFFVYLCVSASLSQVCARLVCCCKCMKWNICSMFSRLKLITGILCRCRRSCCCKFVSKLSTSQPMMVSLRWPPCLSADSSKCWADIEYVVSSLGLPWVRSQVHRS